MNITDNLVNSMDVDISEKYVVTANRDSLVKIFVIKELELVPFAELSGHKGFVTKALFVNQGEIIVSSDFHGKLIIWKLEGKQYSKKVEIQVYDGPIHDFGVRYEHKEMKVFCGCDDGKLMTVLIDDGLRNTISEQKIHKYATTCVSVNEMYVLSGGLDGVVNMIDKDGNIEKFSHHSEQIVSVALSPITERSIFATCSKDGKLFIFKKDDVGFIKQEFEINSTFNSLVWDKQGFSLTVSFGNEDFKTYILNENDEYEEVPIEEK